VSYATEGLFLFHGERGKTDCFVRTICGHLLRVVHDFIGLHGQAYCFSSVGFQLTNGSTPLPSKPCQTKNAVSWVYFTDHTMHLTNIRLYFTDISVFRPFRPENP